MPRRPSSARGGFLEIVRGAGLRLVGPHSLGVVNTDPEIRLNATFSGASVSPGALGICSQSAAPGIGLLGHAAARRLGVSMLCLARGSRRCSLPTICSSTLRRTSERPAVMLYLETFGSPEHFTRIAQRVSRKKPILALKGRRHVESALTEVRSDTAAALRSDTVVDALLHQAGVLRLPSAARSCSMPPSSSGVSRYPAADGSGSSPTQPGWRRLPPTPARRGGLEIARR